MRLLASSTATHQAAHHRTSICPSTMTSATCARLLILHRTPPLLPLLARLPTYNPTTLRHQFRHQFQQLRHASKKASRAATKKIIPPAPAAKATPLPSPLLSQIPKYVSLAESLGNSGGQKIILYTSNDRLFIVGCYGLATAMIAWSVYTWDTNIAKRRPGVPSWVVSATYVSITVMTLLAGVVSYYPTRCGFPHSISLDVRGVGLGGVEMLMVPGGG